MCIYLYLVSITYLKRHMSLLKRISLYFVWIAEWKSLHIFILLKACFFFLYYSKKLVSYFCMLLNEFYFIFLCCQINLFCTAITQLIFYRTEKLLPINRNFVHTPPIAFFTTQSKFAYKTKNFLYDIGATQNDCFSGEYNAKKVVADAVTVAILVHLGVFTRAWRKLLLHRNGYSQSFEAETADWWYFCKVSLIHQTTYNFSFCRYRWLTL